MTTNAVQFANFVAPAGLADALELALQVHPAVAEVRFKLVGADPKLGRQTSTIAEQLIVALSIAHHRRGWRRIAQLICALEHSHRLLRLLGRAVSCGYLDFAELWPVLSLVHRLMAFAEDQGDEHQRRLVTLALLRVRQAVPF